MCKEFTAVWMNIWEELQFIILTSWCRKISYFMLAPSWRFWIVCVLAQEEANLAITCSYKTLSGIFGDEPKMLAICDSCLPWSNLKSTPRRLNSDCEMLTIYEVGSLDTNFRKVLRLRLMNINKLFCQLVKNRDRFDLVRGDDIGEKVLVAEELKLQLKPLDEPSILLFTSCRNSRMASNLG